MTFFDSFYRMQVFRDRHNAAPFCRQRGQYLDREYWFSPKLGFNLLSKRSDPRIGTQTFYGDESDFG
jgi:hypothetical protein